MPLGLSILYGQHACMHKYIAQLFVKPSFNIRVSLSEIPRPQPTVSEFWEDKEIDQEFMCSLIRLGCK